MSTPLVYLNTCVQMMREFRVKENIYFDEASRISGARYHRVAREKNTFESSRTVYWI